MRAMILPEFGDPNLFEERDVEKPESGPDEVLVHVFASSVNLVDTKLRADGSAAGLEPPVILGADISGVVEEVGPGVTDLAPGDEVYYTPEVVGPDSNGAYAEYHVAPASIVAKRPASLSTRKPPPYLLPVAPPTRRSSADWPCGSGRRSSYTAGREAWAPSPSR